MCRGFLNALGNIPAVARDLLHPSHPGPTGTVSDKGLQAVDGALRPSAFGWGSLAVWQDLPCSWASTSPNSGILVSSSGLQVRTQSINLGASPWLRAAGRWYSPWQYGVSRSCSSSSHGPEVLLSLLQAAPWGSAPQAPHPVARVAAWAAHCCYF